MYQHWARRRTECHLLFLEMVEDGMTKQELERLIKLRPTLWGFYKAWLDRLPEEVTNGV